MSGLESMFGQMTDVWIVVAYVVCMFTVATFKPQQIERPASWQKSYACFAGYLIIPAILTFIMNMLITQNVRNPFGPPGDVPANYLSQFSHIVSKVMLASAVVFGLTSLKVGPSSREKEEIANDSV
ncbi:MAG: hypothetical protein ACKVT0_24145 [Planctomycetaceae bacterium]